jgi:hypothetical protein
MLEKEQPARHGQLLEMLEQRNRSVHRDSERWRFGSVGPNQNAIVRGEQADGHVASCSPLTTSSVYATG